MAGLDNLTDEQLDALIAQKQAAGQVDPIAPENKTLSEMKGLTKAAGTGLVKGATDVAGLPGDVQSLATAGLNSFMPSGGQQKPVPSGGYGDVISALNTARGATELPTSQGIQKKIEGVAGPFYQPQTGAEKVASAAGEAVPFGMLATGAPVANMARAALSGGASEAAGQATEGGQWETPARIAAGMGAYGLSGAAQRARIVNPTGPVSAAAQRLEASGVRVPASALSGSRLQATLEGGPMDVSGPASATMQRQAGIVRPPGDTRQYSQVLDQRQRDLGQEAERLGAATSVPATPQLRQQLATSVANHVGQYGGTSLEKPEVTQALKDYDNLTLGGAPITGKQYQALTQQWNASGVPELRTMAGHLDDAMDKAHPGVWDQWRQNYADYVGQRASADAAGGAASVNPASPDKIVSAMHRRTPMRQTAEDVQTVKAAQPKPYDFTPTATTLAGLAGLGGAAAYHGGMMGASDLGIYGTLMAPPVASLASGVAGPVFRSAGGQNFMRNLDPRVVAGLLAQQGVVPKGAPAQPPEAAPQ